MWSTEFVTAMSAPPGTRTRAISPRPASRSGTWYSIHADTTVSNERVRERQPLNIPLLRIDTSGLRQFDHAW